jgi:hypothetical protein
VIQHYVTFCMGNAGFLLEYDDYPIEHRDPNKVVMPKGSIGFRFYDRTEVQDKDEILTGNEKNVSGWYYKGQRYTLAEVQKMFPDKDILIANMKSNGYGVVNTDYGRWMPLFKNDTVLEAEK